MLFRSLPFGCGLPTKLEVVFRVLACCLFEFTRFCEFLARVGTRRFGQSIAGCGAVDIRGHERFGDQVGQTLDDARCNGGTASGGTR